jgi:hypothetical protein
MFKKKSLKFVFSFMLLFFLTWAIIYANHKYTGGFKTCKILPLQNSHPMGELPHLSEEEAKIFDQEFIFLDRGCQVYVFSSLDNKYVLKLIRYHKYQPTFWMELFSFCSKGKEIKEKYKEAKKNRVKQVYKSYSMAYNELLPITEMVYVHLGKTNYLKRVLTLKNAWGQKIYLDLDNTHFIVQKRAKKFKTELVRLYEQKDFLKARDYIDQYFALIKFRSLKAIRDFDQSGFLRNKGIIDDKLVDMDVGGYLKSDLNENEIVNLELGKFSLKFIKWAEKNTPLLLPYLEEKTLKTLKDANQ